VAQSAGPHRPADLDSGSSPGKASVLETPTESMYRPLPSCVAVGPPAGALPAEVRQTVCRLGVPMASERSGDRLEHLAMYRQLCSSNQEELCKDSAVPSPVARTCSTALRPPGHLTASRAVGNAPVKRPKRDVLPPGSGAAAGTENRYCGDFSVATLPGQVVRANPGVPQNLDREHATRHHCWLITPLSSPNCYRRVRRCSVASAIAASTLSARTLLRFRVCCSTAIAVTRLRVRRRRQTAGSRRRADARARHPNRSVGRAAP
jgi:hypothetical protein